MCSLRPPVGTPCPMSEEEWEARLLLHLTPEVGPARFHGLLARFGSAVAVLRASPRALVETVRNWAVAEGVGDWAGHRARLAQARRVAAAEDFGVLLLGEAGYPAALRRLEPCPPALWVKGTVPAGSGLAIVGTRRASGRACARAADLAAAAHREGHPVVSGGAYGVDAAAHRGALAEGGTTVVVLGGGLDRPYPDRHIALFEAAALTGAVVSPFPPGTPPLRGGFLARNAVIAGLSEAVIVVEAGWRSGARSTALAARRLGITVLAVPGTPGTDRLIAEGARVLNGTGELEETRLGPTGPGPEDEPIPEAQARALEALQALGGGVAEAVAQRADLEPLETIAALMALVVEGRVMQEPGGRYRPLGTAPTRHTAKKEA